MAKILTLSRKIYYSVETLIQQLLSNFFFFPNGLIEFEKSTLNNVLLFIFTILNF